jgi:hypothetical protein
LASVLPLAAVLVFFAAGAIEDSPLYDALADAAHYPFNYFSSLWLSFGDGDKMPAGSGMVASAVPPLLILLGLMNRVRADD